MLICYFGDSGKHSTSYHRATALERLGNVVKIADLKSILKGGLLSKLHFRTGYAFLQVEARKYIWKFLKDAGQPDLCWVNSGEMLGPEALKMLRSLGCPIVLYINDDPFGGRDGRRFDSLKKSLVFYDLAAVVRDINVREFENAGVKKAVRVMMSYDEEAHRPFGNIDDIPAQFRSEMAFIGTWMRGEKRDEFLLKLIQQGLPLSIWGDRWHKSPYFARLKPFYRGSSLGGRDYVAAIQGSKVCLGLLSKGNRDLYTRRSLEIPYAGGLLCAERTPEHLSLYKDGDEAVFWNNVNECAAICKQLLMNDKMREEIRQAGMKRIRQLKVGNEDIVRQILHEIEVF